MNVRATKILSTRRTFVIVLIGVLVTPCPNIASAQSTNVQQAFFDLITRTLEAENGRITLSGEVVDEQGQQLNGVTIEINKGASQPMGTSTRYDRETITVNGTFAIDSSGYSGVTLTVYKDGYYSQRLNFSIELSDDAENQLNSGARIGGQLYLRDGIRVVMEKVGQFANLKSYGGLLQYETNGRGKVIDFDKSAIGSAALQTVQNLYDQSQLPSNSVYILADRNPDGTVSTVRLPRLGTQLVDTFPTRITLIMSDPNGGFIPYMTAIRKNVYHQMKTTPVAGYQQQLILDANYFALAVSASSSDEEKEMFFFFKTNGRFGKGSIGEVSVKNAGSIVLLGSQFRLQPDGSNNVETDEGPAHNLTPVASVDTRAPTITILGNNPATVECHSTYTDAGATATDDTDGNLTSAIVISNVVNTATVGTHTVVYSVSDAAGNRTTATRMVHVVDTTPPQITCPQPIAVGCSLNLETPVNFTVTAADNCDPNPAVTSTPASGSGFRVGTTNVICHTVDASGNTNTCSFTVSRSALGFNGFLPPIGGADATGGDFAHTVRTFKLKSTVPVKFTASCDGTAVTAGVHTLQVIKYSDETTAADPIDATPTDAATTGNQFRLNDGEWHFNLDTKATGTTVGTWQLRATLSDGSTHIVWIALK
jgi:Bacterial surface protein, Ig-like domain/HYR domain